MDTAPFILFDNAQTNRAVLLHGFVREETVPPQAADRLDGLLAEGWRQHLHAALLADYEWGLALHGQPAHPAYTGSLKVLWFRRREDLDDAGAWLAQHEPPEPAGIGSLNPDTDEADYCRTVDTIRERIAAGDCYQINYTVRLNLAAYGSPVRLYRRLRQPVPYAALAHLPAGGWVLCFSPELFLRIGADGTAASEPMKGTAPRHADAAQDRAAACALQADPKNRAENAMIVDLLRNDLGKMAEIGGVSVHEPFKVSAFGSVWQMTSRVSAWLPPATTLAAILRAAFPCGSITGAPKRKSMEWIAALENTPRGLYTGTIGLLEPAPERPLGFSGCLNVVIRTLLLEGDGQGGWRGSYGVGSGIVWDSEPAAEYRECGWKTRFLHSLRPEFDLFETMRAECRRIPHWPLHRERIARSAAALNIPFDEAAADALVSQTLASLADENPQRVKLILQREGSLKTETAPLSGIPDCVRYLTAAQVLPDCDPLRRHKTTCRAGYDAAIRSAERQGAFDVLFFNQSGALLEGARSSVMLKIGGQWYTPPLAADILPGIARQLFMRRHAVRETPISRAMLDAAEEVWLGNALRGWMRAERMGQPENR